MRKFAKNIAGIFERRDLVHYSLLMGLMTVSSLLQAAVVSSVPVFFSALLKGESATGLFSLPLSLDVGDSIQGLSLILFGVVVLSSACSLLTLYLGELIALSRKPAISCRLLETYLHQPYEWYLQQNSADLIKRVVDDVNMILGPVMQQALQFVAKSFDVLLLFLVLVWAKPIVALCSFAMLGFVYLVLLAIGKGHIESAGVRLFAANGRRYVCAQEALRHAKTLKIYRCESQFLDRYRTAAEEAAREQMKIAYFGILPKPLLELCLFGGVFLGVAALTSRGWGVDAILPILALYAAAGIRVLPGAQQLYYSLTTLRSVAHAVEELARDFDLAVSESSGVVSSLKVEHATSVSLDNVSFCYSGAEKLALKGVSLAIAPGRKVAFVGRTGSGKTTIVNLLLRLLEPTDGLLRLPFVDGARVSESVGYVPQDVTFTDHTIEANIAFGVPKDEIDTARVVQACCQAQALEFVEELREGLDYPLGEAASRLSGGQRQRIGIARALYFTPAVLVLDEASSALDAETERNVFSSLFELDDVTLIIISHRLSVLKQCDELFLLREGELVASGDFDHLSQSNDYFRSLLDSFEGD
jgi:ATP-binding cassette, subfamily B, bacterial PglK